jgi:hypothetical protein
MEIILVCADQVVLLAFGTQWDLTSFMTITYQGFILKVLPSCKPVSYFNLILFPNFHITWLPIKLLCFLFIYWQSLPKQLSVSQSPPLREWTSCSLFTSCPKILEKIIFIRLYKHERENYILSVEQFGFKRTLLWKKLLRYY